MLRALCTASRFQDRALFDSVFTVDNHCISHLRLEAFSESPHVSENQNMCQTYHT